MSKLMPTERIAELRQFSERFTRRFGDNGLIASILAECLDEIERRGRLLAECRNKIVDARDGLEAEEGEAAADAWARGVLAGIDDTIGYDR